jgi:hypothetical protein
MTSIRLTNEIREEITTAMLRHRFSTELSALVADRAEFALAVYSDLYKPADRKRIADLPDGWLPTDTAIKYHAGTSYETTPFNGRFYGSLNSSLPVTKDAAKSVSMPFASKHHRTCVATYEATHKLAIRHAELQARFKDISDRHGTAESQVKAALSRASTTGRLIELWPEVAPFCKSYEAAAPALPTIRTAALNAMLDLPVSEAA